MHSRHSLARVFSHLLCVMLALVVGVQAVAQGPPAPPGADVIAGGQLNAQQIAAICAYVDFWSAALVDPKPKPEDVQTSRERLLDPLRKPAVSLDFRNNYSKCVLNKLVPVINGPNCHASVNAIIVISQLGTNRAVDELLGHCDRQLEARWQIRLRAADDIANLLRSNSVDARKVIEAAKKLRDAAKVEDHPLILSHQFESISDADSPSLKEAADRKQVRDVLVDAITVVVDRIGKGGNAANPADPSPLIEPVNAAIGNIKTNKFVALSADEKQDLGKKLGPAIGQLLTIAASNWDAGHSNDEGNRLFTYVIRTCEGFLPIIDNAVRGKDSTPPQTKLKDAWVTGNKDLFTSDLNKWMDVLKPPSYAKL